MEIWLILALGTFFASFFMSFAGFLIYLKKQVPERFASLKKNLVFAPFYLSCLICFSLIYAFTPTRSDFINDIGIGQVIIPLLLAGIIYAVSLISKISRFTPVAIFIAAGISVFLLPADFLMFSGNLPFWLDRLCILLIWFLFSNFYYILNGIDGLAGSQTISIGAAFLVLGIIDAIPLFYTMIAISLISISGSFLILNWFPSRIQLTTDSCRVLGFIIGWLLVFSSAEGLAPCNFIFMTFYILELAQAAIKKISLRDKYESLVSDTTYYQANISGLAPAEICIFLFKLETVLIIIGGFQLYSPNVYSLPALSLILGAWFLNKLKNWQTPDKGLKEINKDFMEDIRQNIEEIKNNLGKN